MPLPVATDFRREKYKSFFNMAICFFRCEIGLKSRVSTQRCTQAALLERWLRGCLRIILACVQINSGMAIWLKYKGNLARILIFPEGLIKSN